MRAYERLLKYIQVETSADPKSEQTPSSESQWDLAKLLMGELREMGIENVELDDKCYIYGSIPSNIEGEVPTVGFVAHIDTINHIPGPGSSARIIKGYDGTDIRLNENITFEFADSKQLQKVVGDDIIVTNGETILGGDDKAGIAAIMTALEYLVNNPKCKHGKIAFSFTPDEEIGGSTKYFDAEKFGANFAYTLDGEEFGTLEYENFCNGAIEYFVDGVGAHPGYAKNIMINALNVAWEIHNMLPAWDRAEHSAGYEGFYHCVLVDGNTEKTHSAYLIKDFDEDTFNKRVMYAENIAKLLNERYGKETITTKVSIGRMNMKGLIDQRPEVIAIAQEAISSCGREPEVTPIRGGTDGVALTFMGIPCPNLGTGTYNHHSVFEFADIQQMDKSVECILKIIEKCVEYR